MSAPTTKPTLGLLQARCNTKLVKILDNNKQKHKPPLRKEEGQSN